jgi:hypothetical protein
LLLPREKDVVALSKRHGGNGTKRGGREEGKAQREGERGEGEIRRGHREGGRKEWATNEYDLRPWVETMDG